MLISYTYYGKKFRFISRDKKDDSSNVYTVVVGKNGSGKSRLLSSIVTTILGRSRSNLKFNLIREDIKNSIYAKINLTNTPSKIITVSTSPFDRFPIPRKIAQDKDYSYLGLRDLMTSNFSIAYVSKIVSSLISAIDNNPFQMDSLKDVLYYLGYGDRIIIKLDQRLTTRLTEGIDITEDPIETFQNIFPKRGFSNIINSRYFYEQDGSPNEGKIYTLFNILNHTSLPQEREFITIEINQHGIMPNNHLFGIQPKDISFLIDCGIIKLRNLELYSLKHQNLYSITDASSGEQSVVMSILGMASQMRDGALVCIDEPEICLHPEWQEKYIQLLIETFRKYNSCHFIIATHSPQIISKLEARDCYVMTMETGQAVSARSLINNSADFQLANVFNHPGFKNEYLSRIGLNILTKISHNKSFDNEDLANYTIIESQVDFLEENDPVLTLFNVLREMKQEYA